MFQFHNTHIADVVIIEPQVHGDQRGFFMETYQKDAFHQAGIESEFIQDNHSCSKKGVFRGFHFQTKHTQAKLVRVIAGSVLDFAIDLRKNSATYGQHVSIELTAKNKKQLFIPKGFAHGFLTLEDDTEFVYKCDDIYSPEHDGGITYQDPELGIDFEALKQQYGLSNIEVSDKDSRHPSLAEFYPNNPF